jgi:CRP-like cAMP-binding protein
LFLTRPAVGFAFWSLTLMDATAFREAITNNGARTHVARLAYLFCEQYYRAREAKLLEAGACSFPVNQHQLGQALGMSHISVNRAMQIIRKNTLAEFRAGKLNVFDWRGLTRVAGFDPTYLRLAKLSEISQRRFRSR